MQDHIQDCNHDCYQEKILEYHKKFTSEYLFIVLYLIIFIHLMIMLIICFTDYYVFFIILTILFSVPVIWGLVSFGKYDIIRFTPKDIQLISIKKGTNNRTYQIKHIRFMLIRINRHRRKSSYYYRVNISFQFNNGKKEEINLYSFIIGGKWDVYAEARKLYNFCINSYNILMEFQEPKSFF